MGKRSTFERRDRDFYPTPPEAVAPLRPYLIGISSYCEPCAGAGDLIRALSFLECAAAYDVAPQASGITTKDAMSITEVDCGAADAFITNPPWDRAILHPLIDRLRLLRPTWLLFDADWEHTKQAKPYLQFCSHIISVGRLKWIPGSKHTGKDNCCWYRFQSACTRTLFHGRQ